MDRRLFLSTAGASMASLAGCLATGGDEADETAGTAGTTDDGDTGSTDHKYPDMISVTNPTPKSPIEHDVDIQQDNLHDPAEPFQLDITLTNSTEETISYGERRQAHMWTATPNESLILLPADAASLLHFNDDTEYWELDDGFLKTEEYQAETLDPGESATESLVLAVPYEERAPQGTPDQFQFQTEYEIHSDTDILRDGFDTEWTFSLKRRSDASYAVDTITTRVDTPLQIATSLRQPDIADPDRPMELEIALSNNAGHPVTYHERRSALFWNSKAEEYVLYPTASFPANHYEQDASSGIWVATEKLAMTMDYQIETIEPGETHTERLLVLAQGEESNPPTQLSFSTHFILEWRDNSIPISWTFDLKTAE